MMKKRQIQHAILFLCILSMISLVSACTKSPEEVRAWIKDKRAPVKMQEFIQNERFSLESKIEAVMVLTERQNSPELPLALGEPLKTEEVNRIVAGAIPRMKELIEKDRQLNETKIKDAAYYLLQLELNDDNRGELLKFIRDWLNSGDNFFRPLAKCGRVEQQRLFETIGMDSLPIYKTALENKLKEFEEAVAKEKAKEAELQAKGEKYRVLSRPSDKITSTIATTLQNLEALKLPGANKMAAEIFLERIEKTYPNMARVYVLPFASNTSEVLLPMAKRIVTDPEYKNENLNYYKDVMFSSYFRNVQKKAGAEICTELIQSDRTGYVRWDCMDILASDRGREGFAALIQSLPNNYDDLKTPTDHPTFVADPSMTYWNSQRAFCSHLPGIFNNQVPLDVFRQLLTKGTTVTQILSMACLSTVGTKSDIELLNSRKNDHTNIKDWGMEVSTLGELSVFSGALLEHRIKSQELAEKLKAEKEAKKKAAKAELERRAKEAKENKAAAPAVPAAADAAPNQADAPEKAPAAGAPDPAAAPAAAPAK